jgi:anti-anti-sigma factor
MGCIVETRANIVHVSGEMTIYAAAPLKEDLFAAMAVQPHACRLDLSNVTELDTCGLQMLLMVKRACASSNAHFSVLQASSAVREVVDLLCIDQLRATAATAEA